MVQPGKTFLVQGDTNSGSSTSPALPPPDQVSTLNPGNGGGSLALVSSTDLLGWTEHPLALVPQPGTLDAAGCWTGSVTDDAGTPTAVLTAVPYKMESGW